MNSILAAIIKFAILHLVAIGTIGSVVIFLVLPWTVRSRDVEVPNLVGESYDQAVTLLYAAGLLVADDIEEKASSDIPKGFVLEQSPPADFKVKRKKPVQVTLSIGDQMVEVPDATGKMLQEVDKILRGAGLRRGRVAEVHSDQFPVAETVIAQTPISGSMHQQGASVHFLVSLGKRSKLLLMPDLRGEPIDTVRSLLKSNGLEVGDETYKSEPEIRQGSIISHQPEAGDRVHVGQVISLEISGSATTRTDRGRLISLRYRVSEEGEIPIHVQIVVEDERRTVTIVDSHYEPGTLIEKPPLRVFGEAAMTVYENGVEVQKKDL
ncbi:MAG: PASTA domain-containing protein [Candidatus Poribacteria bacterium]|nr:PASTA domain-containing protein [Candidatus Poribacteria bacterium]MDE0503695.1 PASTA domain-containing protein [Candidatus Poribacteria bacterium]